MKTMKSWMFAAILLCGTGMNAQAQDSDYYDTKDEVAFSIGSGTNSQILDVFTDLFGVMGEALVTSVVTGGTYTGTTSYDNKSTIPAFSIEYFHHLNKVISIGAVGAFNGYSKDMYVVWQRNDGSSKASKEDIGYAKKYYISLMPAVKFDWLRKENFGLYSKIAIGATYMYEKEVQEKDDSGNEIGEKEVHSESKWMGNFQASLLGIEAGSQKLRGFAEFGFGEQGIVLVGARYKF